MVMFCANQLINNQRRLPGTKGTDPLPLQRVHLAEPEQLSHVSIWSQVVLSRESYVSRRITPLSHALHSPSPLQSGQDVIFVFFFFLGILIVLENRQK